MNTENIKIGPKQIAIILLTLTTAGIHLSLLFPDVMFTLNALGYLTLLALYFLPVKLFIKYHGLVRWVFMGYVLLTILAWLLIGDKSWPGGMLGYFAKTVEVVLIILLWTDRQKQAN